MSIFREIPPTAGFNIPLTDFLSAFTVKEGALGKDFENYLGVDYAKVVNSGTAAFYLILESLKALSSRRTVIIPGFVCPLVPLAIARAGLKVKVCDIQENNFNYDYPALQEICSKNNDILAIVAVHLAGIPLDFNQIEALCRKYGIFSVEDCAQSLGARYKDRKTGALGDFSFFSLCRGKGLTIYEGGVAVTRHAEYKDILNEKASILFKKAPFAELIKIIELFGYAVFYRPYLFWWVFRLPELFWNLTGNKLKAHIEYFSADFPIHSVSGFRKKIGHLGFKKLERELSAQRDKAQYLKDSLRGLGSIVFVKEGAEDFVSYPYLSILIKDENMRTPIEKYLSGLGLSRIYLFAISDYKYLEHIISEKDLPSASYIAENSLTISTSKFLNRRDLSRIIDKLKSLKGE